MFVRSLEREETRVIDFLEDKKLMFLFSEGPDHSK